MKVIITGTTGYVGKDVALECLDSIKCPTKRDTFFLSLRHRYRKLTLEEINRHWIETEMSEGLQMWQQARVSIYYYIVRINICRDYSAVA